MKKNQLVDAVATAADLKKSAATLAVDAVLETIVDALKKYGEVRLAGFGTFAISKDPASEGGNLKIGEAIEAARPRQLRFKAGKPVNDRTTRQRRVTLHPARPIETSEGTGLGERISREEGLRRIRAYAAPMSVESWAGPVSGPSELERDYGIRRSTLNDWRGHGAVIGLLRGMRKHVFPLAQFVDGRPVAGIAEVMKIIAMPRAAWLWLSRPHPGRDGTAPIERLKDGRIEEVLAMAKSDFG